MQRKQKKKLQANPFNAQEVKETVVQAEWKNWISLAAFRAGIIGMSWGADGCPLRYRYQVCQINLEKKGGKKEKKEQGEMPQSSTLPHKCKQSNKTCWKNQKAPNATDRNRENIKSGHEGCL